MAQSPGPPETPKPLLSADDVRKVARLSRLALSEAQVESYRRQLSAVLGYVDRLRQLDLASVEPMAHVADTVNRLDEDTPGPTLPNSTLMGLAPDTMEPFIRVPKVIDEGSSA